jgi:hypothetical protein
MGLRRLMLIRIRRERPKLDNQARSVLAELDRISVESLVKPGELP